jgi:predicted permease
LKLPYLYALLAGIFFLWAKIRIPVVIISPLKMIGDLTIPLLLLGLGQRLHDFKMKYLLISLGPVVLRLLGGFIAAIVFVLLFKVSGLTRNIIILIASLPAAITGYMLAEKYNFYPEEVATSVTVSNFVGIFWVPVVIWLLTISGL